MVQGNMSFNATNLKGSGYVDGTPVFSKQLPLTRGGAIVTGKQIGRASCRERVSSPV